MTLVIAMVMLSIPVGNISFADPGHDEDEYSTIDLEVKNSSRTASITVVYTGLDRHGELVQKTLVSSKAKGDDIKPVIDTLVTVTIQEKPDNNNPFPGSVKYHTTETNRNITVSAPFEFTAGDLLEDEGYINYLTSWKENAVYTVTFNSVGGTSVPTQNVEYNHKVSEPTDPTKVGYEFIEWQLDGDEYDFNKKVKKNLYLIAVWEIETYDVTFNSNGGTVVDDEEVDYNTPVDEPEDPTKDHYTFGGWKLNGESYVFSTPVIEDITLEAVWVIDTFEITYNSNGGSTVDSEEVDYNTTATEPTDPIKDHYTFGDWELNGEPYVFSTPVTEDLTLEAVWIIDTFTVSYDSDGGSAIASEEVDYMSQATEPAVPTKTGYAFVEWTLNTVEYDFSSEVTESFELVAVWQADAYNIIFDSNGGSSVTTQVVDYGEKASEPIDPTKDGHSFVEWQLENLLYDFNTVVTGHTTLVAVWDIDEYTIDYNANGGTPVDSENVEYMDLATEPEDPTREGYTFSGWVFDEALYNFSTPVVNRLTLIAMWSEIEVEDYTISFNSNGGSAVGSQIVLGGFQVSKPSNPSRTGYTFVRWNLNNLSYDFGQPVNNIFTLDAVWSLIPTSTPSPPSPPTPSAPTPNITLDRDEVELEYGTEALEEFFSYDFTETITGSSDSRVTWHIDDEDIATVDENGVVTAVSAGETMVTVRHTASGDTDTAVVIVFLVGDEENPLGAIEFYGPYAYGYPDQSFGPQRPVTRGEVATMFANILSLNLDFSGTAKFSDVEEGTWYFPYIQAIYRTQIFVGNPDGTFEPNEPISRGEMATVFSKYWEYAGIPVSASPDVSITDVDATHWANQHIYRIYNAGIVTGFPDGTFRPNDATLREQVVGMINLLIARPVYLPPASKFNDIDSSHWAYGDIEAATEFFTKQSELPVEEE